MLGAMDGRREHETGRDEVFTMRDGRMVRIRRIRPDDAPRLVEFHGRLSDHSKRMRFFVPMKRLGAPLAERLSRVDFEKRAAFVVSHITDDTIHGVGRYEYLGEGIAEIAFVVEDVYQGEGLATELLGHLASHARAHGIEKFTAITLLENRDMIEVFRHCGLPMAVRLDPPVQVVTLDLTTPAGPGG